jgi:hypothetical protein
LQHNDSEWPKMFAVWWFLFTMELYRKSSIVSWRRGSLAPTTSSWAMRCY